MEDVRTLYHLESRKINGECGLWAWSCLLWLVSQLSVTVTHKVHYFSKACVCPARPNIAGFMCIV